MTRPRRRTAPHPLATLLGLSALLVVAFGALTGACWLVLHAGAFVWGAL